MFGSLSKEDASGTETTILGKEMGGGEIGQWGPLKYMLHEGGYFGAFYR